jgi:heme oxygenase
VNLRDATRELHHAAERHAVGSAMSAGTIGPQRWSDWLGALLVVHGIIDPSLPAPLRRAEAVARDLNRLAGYPPRWCASAARYAVGANHEAAAYVFTGAHLMGGAIMARKLGDRLPCEHLAWHDRASAVRLWEPLRERADLVLPAREAFGAILHIMDEIVSHDAA